MNNRLESTSNYNEIKNNLYNLFHKDSKDFSSMTSSYWEGKNHNRVEVCPVKNGTDELSFDIKGFGIGGYKRKTFLRKVRTFFESTLNEKLLANYCQNPLVIKALETLCSKKNIIETFDTVKHALSLNEIVTALEKENKTTFKNFRQFNIETICVIGDGYGFMSSLIHEFDPEVNVVVVNLGKSLILDVDEISKLYPHQSTTYFDKINEKNTFFSKFNFLAAENYHFISSFKIELFINIHSMQEMNMETINNYFHFMRQSKAFKKYFYCLNRSLKVLPCGEVIDFNQYPWQNSKTLAYEQCPKWHLKNIVSSLPFYTEFAGDHSLKFIEL